MALKKKTSPRIPDIPKNAQKSFAEQVAENRGYKVHKPKK